MVAATSGGKRVKFSRPQARVGDSQLVEVRHEQIVRAAKKLFSRQGFAKTVIRDIAREAGFSVGLVYEYVRTKEDILFLMLERDMELYRSGLKEAMTHGDNGMERLLQGIRFYVKKVDGDRDGILIWYREPGHLSADGKALVKTGERSIVQVFADGVATAQSDGLIKPDVDPMHAAALIELSCHGRALKPHFLCDEVSWEDYVATITSTVLEGLATDAGRACLSTVDPAGG